MLEALNQALQRSGATAFEQVVDSAPAALAFARSPASAKGFNGSHPYPLSARPPAFDRNSLRTPLFANVDFRLLKYFPVSRTAHLDLVAEAFNLFNRTNVIQINPVFGTGLTPLPGFTRPITGSGARQIQFSLDFEFLARTVLAN